MNGFYRLVSHVTLYGEVLFLFTPNLADIY